MADADDLGREIAGMEAEVRQRGRIVPFGELIARLAQAGGEDEIFEILASTEPPTSSLDRAHLREKLLDVLKGKLQAPSKSIDAWLREFGEEDSSGGRPLTFEEPDPWLPDVDGAELLDDMVSFIRAKVFLTEPAADAVALWILFAFTIDAFDIAPLLLVTSPTKRCGKTKLLTLIMRLTPRALPASNITPAALFRAVEAVQPTLCIDEADTFARMNEELRGILNSGHTRDLANVIRSVGDAFEPRLFSTWCPKAVALIGTMPPTVMDRSIVVPMQRKERALKVEPLPYDEQRSLTTPLIRRSSRWGLDHTQALRAVRPALPIELNDRAADNWRPLLGIAEAVAGDWPTRARRAALALSGMQEDEQTSIVLLGDIAEIFARAGMPPELPSDTILKGLHLMDDRPWSEWGRAKREMTGHALAKILKPFGVKPRPLADGSARGYRLTDGLASAIETYTDVRLTPIVEASNSQVTDALQVSANVVADGGVDDLGALLEGG